MLADLTRRQVEEDDVTLLIINDRVDPMLLSTFHPRVKVVRLNRRPSANPLALFWSLNRAVRRLEPDVINCHNANTSGVLRGLDRKLVFTIHDENIPAKYLRKSMKYIAISDTVYKDMQQRRPEFSITTVADGIETELIERRNDSVPSDKVRIVNIARLQQKKKGQDILLEALTHLPEEFSVDFIGEGEDSEALQDMARTLGVESHVNFLGKRSRKWIYAHLADYDMLVHPSRYEGFGLTVAEAMAAGIPVAVASLGGPAEIIQNGRLGEVFDLTPQECAAAIMRIADNYKAALMRATLARDIACRNYSMKRMAAQYREVYQNLLNCKV